MSTEETTKKEEKVESASNLPEVLQSGSIEELTCLVKAHVPYIFTVTHDEDRFIKEVYTKICASDKMKRDLYIWSAWQGLVKYNDNMSISPKRASGDLNETWNPQKAMTKIEELKHDPETKGGIIFIMRDFHTVLAQPIPRQMRDMYELMTGEAKTMIILGGQLAHGPGASKGGMEPSLEKQVAVVRYALPTREMIETRLRDMVKATDKNKNKKLKREYSNEEYFALSRALQGLTYTEIDNATAVCMAHLRRLDVKRLMGEKKQVIMRSEILEYIESSNDMSSIGGMDAAKDYFDAHDNANDQEAEDFGVEPLKGVLLLGCPGTGKSALAKSLGNKWGVPTLRLDVGKVMTGLVGGSEEKMRAVVALCKATAPIVLWIDEIEKALSGTKSSNFSDGGTLARVFGTLLTSMEEDFKGVTVVATANDISALPPELIRRFSEVFYVNLPVNSEREEIFSIHLAKRKRNPKDYDLKALAAVSEDYTGAEIEKAIKESIARCWNDGKRKVTTEDLVQAVKDTKPISLVMSEKIGALKEWARTRARYASSEAEKLDAPGKQTVKTKSGKSMSVAESLEGIGETKPSKKEAKEKPSRLDSTEE